MDCGREFEAELRKTLFHEYGITRKMTTPRNSQANSMVERAHQTVHNTIATLDLKEVARTLRAMKPPVTNGMES